MRAAKCPTEELTLSNCAVVSDRDFDVKQVQWVPVHTIFEGGHSGVIGRDRLPEFPPLHVFPVGFFPEVVSCVHGTQHTIELETPNTHYGLHRNLSFV